MLRKHQKEMIDVVDKIIKGSPIRTIVCSVCPGGGKSTLPIIAGRLITAGLADALCWVVPRQSLQDQGERNFLDPFFREMFQHRMVIRSSTNEDNPCRGLSGFVTTYQSLAADKGQTVLFDFIRRRYVLVLDEFHHVEEGGVWHEALKPLIKRAPYLVLMTGTIQRGDRKKIAFMPYRRAGSGCEPCLEPDRSTAIIKYGRQDALSEKAIIPLRFFLSDGQAHWIDKDGAERRADISKAPKNIAGQALFTALSTDFADELLESALKHWQGLRQYNPRAKLLVVTANYDLAKETVKKLKEMDLNSEIATSHEPEKASLAIKRFKNGAIDILVTIAIAYEGLDCPGITHIACLTNIRSTPWIEQMVARAVRVDRKAGPYESQMGYIFAPDDVLFREIMDRIRREQLPFVEARNPRKQKNLFPEGEGVPNIQIEPLGSKLNGHREVFLGGSQQQQAFNEIPLPEPETPTEIATALRARIENHVRLYSFNNRYKNGKINAEIKAKFGKSREQMTIPELKQVVKYVHETYPLDRIRGRGHRVPAKVVRWYGDSVKSY